MSRKSTGPRYWKSKNGYYAILQGDRIPLCDGPKTKANDELAQERYDAEVAARSVQKEGDRAEAWTVFNAYQGWCEEHLKPSTAEMNGRFMQSFIEVYGHLPWRELRSSHFDEWLAEKKRAPGESQRPGGGWGPGGR